MKLRSALRLLWLGMLAGLATSTRAQEPPSFAILTNAADVMELSREQAMRKIPVLLHATVLGEDMPGGSGVAIQDASSGIYLRSTSETVAKLSPGDLVEVEGYTDPGDYAPFVRATRIGRLGSGPVAEPKRVTFDELLGGGLDAQWVEVSGVVRYCERSPGNPPRYRLELQTGGGRLVVRVNLPQSSTPHVDDRVRVRGVCYYLFNRQGQSLSPMMAVPGGIPVIVDKAAPGNPFETPVQPAGTLLRYRPGGSHGHRVHVRGVVTHYEPGEILFIRDNNLGLRINSSQPGTLVAGDEVDVLGFPVQGDYSAVLEDAVFQKRSSGRTPKPLPLTNAVEAFDHDADLVEIEGVLDKCRQDYNRLTFEFRTGKDDGFTASLVRTTNSPPPATWLPGSLMRVAGVCSVSRDPFGYASGLSKPVSFQLTLRSAGDLRLISPPSWWTREHVVWVLGGIAFVAVLAVAGVTLAARARLREQAARRGMAEVEFHAILAERNRVARDIHDVLAQGLNAIQLHLDLAKDQFKQLPETTAKHLTMAHELTRSSVADARAAVWNIRSQVLEKGDLVTAVQGVLTALAEGIQTHCDVSGNRRRLSPEVENAVLRVAQEAITNATKHAHPRSIRVRFEFAERHVKLSVEDDGAGFNPDQPITGGGGFGQVGMRERAQQLGGELTVRSAPGKGAEVMFRVPVSSV